MEFPEQKCGSCGWIGTKLKLKQFGVSLTGYVCPRCSSEKVFDYEPEKSIDAQEEERFGRRRD